MLLLTIPAVPGSFTATPINAGEVDLSWSDVAGAASYTIERATNGGQYGPLVSGLASNVATYPDTTVSAGTIYQYRIHATNATGDSATTTQAALTVPAAPTTVVRDAEWNRRSRSHVECHDRCHDLRHQREHQRRGL